MKLNNKKDKIEELYLNGFNASQITNILNSKLEDKKIKRETIQKHIQRNLLNKRMQHNIKVLEKKEAIKAVNYESTRCMSDKSFISKNKSIYRTKPNGDIVIDKEVAPVVTWDTPKTLLNQKDLTLKKVLNKI
ncbi:hypothetical protein [Clostridium gasigenes]|uniref:Uncharacterized protein n=1 Tax=Clostridium gasigenes TaxID=94869 RepID=A0A1H0M6R9_9CLOT|nr:hypothetical protein [Clostridium gasigenes]SDO76094.1 hypothetical protein SAMN04488529_101343 [Clostridium gasigenes]